MAYPTITPVTSIPADDDDANSQELQYADVAHCHVYVANGGGTGTAALLVKDPKGRWVQAGPSWSVAATQAGREPGRIQIPRDKRLYKILVTGGPTLADCYLVGCSYGR